MYLLQQEIAPNNRADTHHLRVMGVAAGFSADFTPAVIPWSLPVQLDADSHELVHSLSDHTSTTQDFNVPKFFRDSEADPLNLSMKHKQAGFTSLDTVPC